MALTNLQGTAIRHQNQIEVNLLGHLGNSCQTASITGSSPGAGTAKVDIKTGTKPGSHFCSMVMLPWADSTLFPDKNDTHVEVFIDGVSALKIAVKGKPELYEVYRNINGGSCIIVPQGTMVLAIYAHAFGPASREACEKYVADNCGGDPI